ncbi:SAM-dependent methyltransferase [Streptomyces sp. NPDC058001]|uniref:SAM-dependent methyltransferase n=1 Tax=Streptomyces sp. NPDC058001 TaxID=3346300 RepID=UPI0036EF63B5
MDHGDQPLSHSIDLNTPSVARMYDWLLDGIDNYEVDQAACQDLLKIAPSTKALAQNNRAFLRRVVRVLAEDYGIRQFLDHGSGLPTRDNVHEVAQRIDPEARVVYVDNDPIVLAHGRTRLVENDRTAIVQADMRDTATIFEHPDVVRLIRAGEPTAALFVSVMHCLKDDDVQPLIERVKARLEPGSLLVICQLVSEHEDVRTRVTALMKDATHDNWGRVREEHEVRGYLDGLDIIEPGLRDVTDWRPDNEVVPRQRDDDWVEWGGVGRMP